MRDNRLKITLTDDERELFEQCKVRASDPLASTIVRLALEQARFLRKAASGEFRKNQQPQTTGGYSRDTRSSQER